MIWLKELDIIAERADSCTWGHMLRTPSLLIIMGDHVGWKVKKKVSILEYVVYGRSLLEGGCEQWLLNLWKV